MQSLLPQIRLELQYNTPVETQLYWVSSRYYSPELCRFLQVSDISNLNPSSINGLNLYTYANNNPISNAHNASSIGGSINGGMASSNSISIG